MKTELQAKMIQYALKLRKGDNKGFTLIELLVVIIIIGILSAIALPSFLNQANKARQSEAQTYVGTLNRGQQAYYLEENKFAAELINLELGIVEESETYAYATGDAAGELTNAGVNSTVTNTATPVEDGATVKGFAGRVWVSQLADDTATTLAVLCEGTPNEVPVVTAVELQSECPNADN
ncbi:MAG: type IV pilin-like G/H family protein [Elainellaceae cyanobacterium]